MLTLRQVAGRKAPPSLLGTGLSRLRRDAVTSIVAACRSTWVGGAVRMALARLLQAERTPWSNWKCRCSGSSCCESETKECETEWVERVGGRKEGGKHEGGSGQGGSIGREGVGREAVGRQ